MKKVFLDTNVFVSGLIEVGDGSACRAILQALATRRLRECVTAWHCCLEFYSVTTRLPPDYRLSSEAAITLLTEHILDRVQVADLPVRDAVAWLRSRGGSHVRGGLIYDAHIAQVAVRSRCSVLVTENVSDFRFLAPDGIEIMTPAGFAERL